MEYYVALYDYDATTASNLTLMQGETVLVLEKASNGWWNGEASQGTGWFPETYVGKRDVRVVAAGGRGGHTRADVGPSALQKDMLPMGWQAHADDAGRVYYTNLITQDSVWEKPTKPSFVSTDGRRAPPFAPCTPRLNCAAWWGSWLDQGATAHAGPDCGRQGGRRGRRGRAGHPRRRRRRARGRVCIGAGMWRAQCCAVHAPEADRAGTRPP
jgi:hypothetical protein